jgi:Tfp pilus assembly protein PilF
MLVFLRIVTASLALCEVCSAGAVLKGLVLENEVGGPPASGVQITSTGANPTTTGDDGQFTLGFPGKQPGDPVRLAAAKAGYVVVNDVQLEQMLPVNPDAKPLLILVCRQASREEMARRYYRLRGLDAIEADYRKRLAELQSTGSEAIGHLRQERDQARSAAEKAAEDLARAKPGQTSELYNRAMRLFLDGQIEQALKILGEERLRGDLAAAKQRKVEAEKEVEQAAESWVLKAQLLTTQFRFADAEAAYREALDAAPNSLGVNFAFAWFSQGLKRHAVAAKSYERCLEIARQDRNEAAVALALNNLGDLDRDRNRMDDARQAFEEALKIRRELARKSSGAYLADVAATLNNLGILDRDQNRMDDARRAFEEALDIRSELARQNPETYLPDVAMTLNNLGILGRDQNRMDNAREAFGEALKTYRELARKNPETYLPNVAMALNNLGVFHREQNRMDDARQAYEEALKIYRELARKNPETYVPDLARTLNNLGVLDGDQNRMDDARRVYEEALKIYRDLARKNPETYLPYIAGTTENLGVLDSAQNRMDDARQAYEEALKIRRDLARRSPETYLRYVAGTLDSLGTLDNVQNRLDDARQAYEEALRIQRELARKSPETYLPDVATTLNDLGVLDREQNRTDDARQAYEQALGIFNGFAVRDPERFRTEIANLIAVLTELGK